MSDPGEDAGDCPRCGETMVMIGHGTVTLGTYCDHCDLLVALQGKTMTLSEALDAYDDDHGTEAAHERHEPDAWGPDPMP